MAGEELTRTGLETWGIGWRLVGVPLDGTGLRRSVVGCITGEEDGCGGCDEGETEAETRSCLGTSAGSEHACCKRDTSARPARANR